MSSATDLQMVLNVRWCWSGHHPLVVVPLVVVPLVVVPLVVLRSPALSCALLDTRTMLCRSKWHDV